MAKLLAWLRDEREAGRGLAPASAVEEVAAEVAEAAAARDGRAAEVLALATRRALAHDQVATGRLATRGAEARAATALAALAAARDLLAETRRKLDKGFGIPAVEAAAATRLGEVIGCLGKNRGP